MNRTDLRALEARTRAVVDVDPPSTRSETQRWIVEPLLAALGWDPRSAATDVAIGGRRFAYVLSVSETPALVVAVQPFTEAMDAAVERALRDAMAATGIDRAIHTNGHTVRLLGGTNATDRFECPRDDLVANADALEHVSRSSVERRLATESRQRVARRVAVNRAELGERIEDELSTVVGDEPVDVGAATDAFLSKLIEDLLSHGDEAQSDHSPRSTERSGSDDATAPAQPARDHSDQPTRGRSDEPAADRTPLNDDAEGGGGRDVEDRIDRDSNADGSDGKDTEADETSKETADASESGDGEYVVRFFGDRGSIGAIGHSSARGALVEAAEYLFQRGLSGIRLPWSPDGSDVTVVNDRPELATGEPMERYRELSNGYVVNTTGTATMQANRIRALADRAGLRAMLTGDWESSDE